MNWHCSAVPLMNLGGILVADFAFCPDLGWGMPGPSEGLGGGRTAFRCSWTAAQVPGRGGRAETRESRAINQPRKAQWMCQRSAGLVSICDRCLVAFPAVGLNIYVCHSGFLLRMAKRQRIQSKCWSQCFNPLRVPGGCVSPHVFPLVSAEFWSKAQKKPLPPAHSRCLQLQGEPRETPPGRGTPTPLLLPLWPPVPHPPAH